MARLFARQSMRYGLLRMDFLGHEESKLEGLAGVEARVAIGVVAVRQSCLGDCRETADAFGDIVAGHLDMNAAGIGPHLAVNLEEVLHLAQDAVERTGLEACGSLDGVAVH